MGGWESGFSMTNNYLTEQQRFWKLFCFLLACNKTSRFFVGKNCLFSPSPFFWGVALRGQSQVRNQLLKQLTVGIGCRTPLLFWVGTQVKTWWKMQMEFSFQSGVYVKWINVYRTPVRSDAEGAIIEKYCTEAVKTPKAEWFIKWNFLCSFTKDKTIFCWFFFSCTTFHKKIQMLKKPTTLNGNF